MYLIYLIVIYLLKSCRAEFDFPNALSENNNIGRTFWWQRWESLLLLLLLPLLLLLLRQLFCCWGYYLKPVASQHSPLKWQTLNPLSPLSPSSPLPHAQSIPIHSSMSCPLSSDLPRCHIYTHVNAHWSHWLIVYLAHAWCRLQTQSVHNPKNTQASVSTYLLILCSLHQPLRSVAPSVCSSPSSSPQLLSHALPFLISTFFF